MRRIRPENTNAGNRGFTLVELAIVVTIIGLLIGGVLKGQELVNHARLSSTLSQVRAIDGAVAAFVDKYDYLPGDMPNAGDRLTGCNANCSPVIGGANGGNGVVGRTNWNYIDVQDRPLPHPPTNRVDETHLFWLHLYKAKLLTGVTDDAMVTANLRLEFGVTHPATAVAGVGWHVATAPAGEPPLPGSPAARGLSEGLFIYTVPLVTDRNLRSSYGNVTAPFRPGDASYMDRKLDDGRPASGTVQAFGAAGCFKTSGSFVVYNDNDASRQCALAFRIHN